MKIRKIDKNDRLEILKGDLYAYSRWTNQDLPRSHLTAINPEEVLVAEIDGKIAAALQCFRMQQSVRGTLKAMGGIGGIWTYPEYRNRGCVKALIKSAFLEMRMHGISVSMLTPFKASFYETLGYAIANANHEVEMPIAALSPYLKSSHQSTKLDNLTCDRLAATEVKDILANFLFESLRSHTLQPHSHGLAITNFNYDQWWHLHRQKLCVVIKRDCQPVAIAIYSIDSSSNQPMRDRCIEISSIFWTDLPSRDRLWQFFASHRDQIHILKMPLPLNTNPHNWLGDAGILESRLSEPWMVCIVDLVGALHGLPLDCEPLTFAISDSHCHWNEGIFTISSDRSFAPQIAIKRHNGEQFDGAIDFYTTIAGISALIYGTAAIEQLMHKQWITEINPATRQKLEKCFMPCLIYNPFKF